MLDETAVFRLLEAGSWALMGGELSEEDADRLSQAIGGCLVVLALLDLGERVQ